MHDYYHQQVTDTSWRVLQNLAREVSFVLIGGWAVYLYTHSLKSKDIDMVVSLEELSKMKSQFNLIKNDRLKKYEVHQEEVDIDIYVEHYSNPGIPAEDLAKRIVTKEGFRVPAIEVLLFLKQNAWRERRGSAKGKKDEIDMLSLLIAGIQGDAYARLLQEYQRDGWKNDLAALLQNRSSIPELELNEHQYARLKSKLLPMLHGLSKS